MSMAIGNPDDIDAIAGALESYLNTVEEETNRFNSAFEQYGDSWKDEKRQAFEETYGQLRSVLEQFSENASEQIPYLRDLARILREYLQH